MYPGVTAPTKIERIILQTNTNKRAVYGDGLLNNVPHKRQYRYLLEREWSDAKKLHVHMLNPSTADDKNDDPTLNRLIWRAYQWGFGGLLVTNLYAFRCIKPSKLWFLQIDGENIIGPDNDVWLDQALLKTDVSLLAWGNNALVTRERIQHFLLQCRSHVNRKYYCLGYTHNGAPRHPLHLGYNVGAEWFNFFHLHNYGH